jgi:hypothetical protein
VNEQEQEQIEQLQDVKTRGETVAAFLQSPAVVDCWKSLEASYFAAWKESRDPAEREQLHNKASALDDLKETLLAVASSAEHATQALADLKRENVQI